MSIEEARKKIKLRREQLAFDKLPKAEQEKRRHIGLDPYEPEHIRAKKKAAELERRKREFDRLPLERRRILEKIGWSPYQKDIVIRRVGGEMAIKN